MSRYPKRKLPATSYAVEAVVDEVEIEDDDDDWHPTKKAKTTSKAKGARGRLKKKKDTAFDFMDLPGELRNKIYEYLVCQPGGSVYIGEEWSSTLCRKRVIFSQDGDMRSRTYQSYRKETSNNFAILRTCKKVSREAAGIMYGQTFRFSQVDALQSFLLGRSPTTMGLMRRIDIAAYINNYTWKFLPLIFALLRPATGLEYLRVQAITGFRNNVFESQLHWATGNSHMTVADWDALVARQIAREAYSHMYPYLQTVIREKGAEETMKILHIFGDLFERGPHRYAGDPAITHGSYMITAPNNAVLQAPESPARAAAMRAAVGAEIARLVASDRV
ncbi:hypothetical protein VSDG_08469 [Cytospora chrysosperma]|uniref:Uncharacterized protein n=1 Tax=Cytospora chrysosperma TaxID=252740 RepID=A0A423VHD6_CYTCH|nr:hypothetical protein VSDG_08469 [Valsa sordida]